MKSIPLVLCGLLTAATAWAQSPSTPAPAAKSGGSAEAHSSSSTSGGNGAEIPEDLRKLLPARIPGADGKPVSRRESSSKHSSSSKSETVETKSINGKTVTVKRTRDGNGSDKVTITTTEAGGKPKVEEMSGSDYDAKFGPKKPGAGNAPAAPGKVDLPVPPSLSGDKENPKPAATGKATE